VIHAAEASREEHGRLRVSWDSWLLRLSPRRYAHATIAAPVGLLAPALMRCHLEPVRANWRSVFGKKWGRKPTTRPKGHRTDVDFYA
jgi:hypothetical protein